MFSLDSYHLMGIILVEFQPKLATEKCVWSAFISVHPNPFILNEIRMVLLDLVDEFFLLIYGTI